MERNGTPEKALTPRQVAALPYLVATPSIAEGSRLAHVGRTTLFRWMQDDEFRSRLEQDPNPNIRLRAAQMTLTTGHKIIDVENVERRLDLIDHAMDRRDL